MVQAKRKPGPTEIRVGAAVLLLLIVIAVGIGLKQLRYDPTWFGDAGGKLDRRPAAPSESNTSAVPSEPTVPAPVAPAGTEGDPFGRAPELRPPAHPPATAEPAAAPEANSSMTALPDTPAVASPAAPPEAPSAGPSPAPASQSTPEPGSAAIDPASFLPESMQPMSPPEVFDATTLSDKIDGKAELYLSAGFRSLSAQRFAMRKAPAVWVEVFLYDMETAANAYAVYSAQRRSGVRDLNLTPSAYATRNGIYLAHGRYYLEAVAAARDELLAEAVYLYCQAFVTRTRTEAQAMVELTLFPTEGLSEDGVTLLADDAFGMAGFKNVYTAEYRMGEELPAAFVAPYAIPEEARDQAAAYRRFLIENGAADADPGPALLKAIPGASVVDVFGTFEIIFSHGRYLAGVRAAETRETADRLALMLQRKLREAPP